MPTHLITGVTGQDGVLLARLLRSEGGRIVGTCRPGSVTAQRMSPYLGGVEVVELDLRDRAGFTALLDRVRPDEVYNLAAMSSIGRSWGSPEEAVETNGSAPAAMLRALARYPQTRWLQAASIEETVGATDSPYAQGKREARSATAQARLQGRFASAAVLHIHESPIRRPEFVVRKITRGVAGIRTGQTDSISLGNLAVVRDWGSASDSVVAMRMIMRAEQPGEHEVATGRTHSLREIVEIAFAAAGIDDPWAHVRQDRALERSQDVDVILGRPTTIFDEIGWRPARTLEETIEAMVAVDIRRLRDGVEEQESYLDPPAQRGHASSPSR